MWVAAVPGLPLIPVSTAPTSPAAAKPTARPRAEKIRLRGWRSYVLLGVATLLVLFSGTVGYFYITFSRMIDARMHGEFQRADPRIFARPFAAIPSHMVRAVVAIEDRRFYDHPGIDIIGTTRAVLTNIFGTRKYLSGGSMITQQLVTNTFLTQEKSLKRKFTEWFMSVALERR